MKYLLIEKNPTTQESIYQTEYKSLLQMSKALKTTYCCCYNNFNLNKNASMKKPKKYSQLNFNNKFKIVCVE